MANSLKSRWWWFIAYPDSLPNNWKDKLLLTGIPFIVSPLHDSDLISINPSVSDNLASFLAGESERVSNQQFLSEDVSPSCRVNSVECNEQNCSDKGVDINNSQIDDVGGLSSHDVLFKKPHYHIIVIFDNPTTYNHVLTHCCKPINATIPQVILNLSGSIAYLTHKGIENKAQYQTCDIECFNGSQVYLKDAEYISDVYSAIEFIVRDKHPANLLDLIDACKDITDAVSLIRSKPFYFSQILRF